MLSLCLYRRFKITGKLETTFRNALPIACDLGQILHAQLDADAPFLLICYVSKHLKSPEPLLHALREFPHMCEDFNALPSASLLSLPFHI